MNARLAAVGFLLLSTSALAAPPAPTTEAIDLRIQRIERILRNQSMSEMLLRIQRLEREVQQLRGDLESESHAVQTLKKQQRELYLDIDNRLGQMNAGGGSSSSMLGDTQTSTVPSSTTPSNQVPETASKPAIPAAVAPKKPIASAPASVVEGEDGAYQASFNLLKQGRYDDAIVSFTAFVDRYPGGSYADNAQYWLGEANYVNRDFDTALKEFAKVVDEYGASPKVPGAMLKMGYIHYEQKDWKGAREALERLTSEYPSSSESRLAEKRLKKMLHEGR